jgi:hypothetical protein
MRSRLHPEMPDDLARHRSLLMTALVAAQLPERVPEAQMVRSWLDSWSGAGQVVEAMHELGYNAFLMQSLFVWSAEFCRNEVNPVTKWIGRAHGSTPWRAVQLAAIDTLERTRGGVIANAASASARQQGPARLRPGPEG